MTQKVLTIGYSPSYLQHRTTDFLRIMDLYQENSKEASKLKFSVRGKFTWDQVMNEAELAQEKYVADGKGVRNAFRVVSNFSPGLDPWLKLLPDGEYTSVVCGCLKLMFGVSTKEDTRSSHGRWSFRGDIMDRESLSVIQCGSRLLL